MKTAGLGLPFNALCTICFFVYNKRLLIVIVREAKTYSTRTISHNFRRILLSINVQDCWFVENVVNECFNFPVLIRHPHRYISNHVTFLNVAATANCFTICTWVRCTFKLVTLIFNFQLKVLTDINEAILFWLLEIRNEIQGLLWYILLWQQFMNINYCNNDIAI